MNDNIMFLKSTSMIVQQRKILFSHKVNKKIVIKITKIFTSHDYNDYKVLYKHLILISFQNVTLL